METSTFHTDLEKQRLEKLAREYQERGYTVIILPSDDFLPEPLKGLVVGILASKGDQLLLADARLREHLMLEGAADLTVISERIEQLPNALWELVVVNNPDNQQGGHDENPSR
jgi:hypothetical protein